MESNGVSAQPFISYQDSVHGRATTKGSTEAAVCTDCHGSHEIIPPNEAKSPIYKLNVPATCGKCHNEITQTFNESIHGQAIARGNQLSPVCTDCHGIHSIKSHKDPNSPYRNRTSRGIHAPVATKVCGSQANLEFQGTASPLTWTAITGWLLKADPLLLPIARVAMACTTFCHRAIRSSTINRPNLDATCGKCHKGATQKFTLTPVHLADGIHPKDIGSKITRWVRIIYTILILGIIGGMFLHNFIIWRSKAVARRHMQNPMMQRMSTNQRWQHLVLLTSFIILVITGFALKFPNSWFADLLGMGEQLRSIVHRIAGVVLIAAGFYHVFYIAIANEGRRMLSDITPAPKDAD